MASGAAKSLGASVSMRVASNFYNIRLVAWEPLLEPWEARLELETSARPAQRDTVAQDSQETPRQHSDQGAEGLERSSRSGLMSDGITPIRQGQGRRQRSRRRRARLVDDKEHAVRTGRPGDTAAEEAAGVVVQVRLISEQTLNVNLTESLVENLAAIVLAQQRLQENGKPSAAAAWVGSGVTGDGSNELFSLNWVRNDTGLPIVCSAGGPAVQIGAGEEMPLPLPRGEDGRGGATVALSDEVRAVAASPAVDIDSFGTAEDVDKRGATESPADGLPPSRTLLPCPLGKMSVTDRRFTVTGRRGSPSSRFTPFGPQSKETNPLRRRSGLRAVVVEIHDDRGIIGSAEARSTYWRSLRPIRAEAVGQRLVTMVASISADTPMRAPTAEAAAARGGGAPGGETVRSPPRNCWPGDETFPEGIDTTVGAHTFKVVTEVELHHGVKVRERKAEDRLCVVRFSSRVSLNCTQLVPSAFCASICLCGLFLGGCRGQGFLAIGS